MKTIKTGKMFWMALTAALLWAVLAVSARTGTGSPNRPGNCDIDEHLP